MLPTAEQQQIRQLARDFAAHEVRPFAAAWDERGDLDPALFPKLAEVGFFGMVVPDAYGGLGCDFATCLMALEELAWGDASVGLAVAAQGGPAAWLIQTAGTERQRREWLPRLASGEAQGTVAVGVGARADRTAAGWRLRGSTGRVLHGTRPGVAIVFADSGEGGPADPSAFLVDTRAVGFRPGERERTFGLRASRSVALELDDVEVADDAVLPRPATGPGLATRALAVARLGTAAQAVGLAQAALEHATDYALAREQFGRPIAGFEAIRLKLAEMAVRVAGARALVHEAARRVDRAPDDDDRRDPAAPTLDGSRLAFAAAAARLWAGGSAIWVAGQAVQIFGGYGFMREYPVEKLLRDAQTLDACQEPSDTLRLAVAEAVLRMSAGGR